LQITLIGLTHALLTFGCPHIFGKIGNEVLRKQTPTIPAPFDTRQPFVVDDTNPTEAKRQVVHRSGHE